MLWANRKLRIIVTSACNLDCFYCHNEGQPKSMNRLGIDLFDHLIDVVHTYPEGLEKVTFSGGEPLLHPALEYFVRRLVPFVKQRTVVTNGLLLDERRLNSLCEAGVSKFRLGVDALSGRISRPSSVYPASRSVHGAIELLHKYGIPYELNVVMTEYNRDEIPMLLRHCGDHRISAKFFEHVRTQLTPEENGNIAAQAMPFITIADFERIVYACLPQAIALPPDAFDGANEIFDCGGFSIRYCRYLCQFGLCSLTGTRVDPRGFVYSCLVGSGQFQISAGASVEDSAAEIRAALGCGCSSYSTVNTLVSA